MFIGGYASRTQSFLYTAELFFHRVDAMALSVFLLSLSYSQADVLVLLIPTLQYSHASLNWAVTEALLPIFIVHPVHSTNLEVGRSRYNILGYLSTQIDSKYVIHYYCLRLYLTNLKPDELWLPARNGSRISWSTDRGTAILRYRWTLDPG